MSDNARQKKAAADRRGRFYNSFPGLERETAGRNSPSGSCRWG